MNYWLLALTFLSVNLDFFFMLLFLLKKYRVQQVMLGYLLGTLILLTLSFAVGKVLASFLPEWLLGILGVLPIYMALHDDDDDDAGDKAHGGPVLTVLVTYLSVCAGCNLSIFLPVLAGETLPHFGETLIFIGVLTLLVVAVLKLIADIPVVTKVMDRYGEPLMKACYILIGLYVFWDSGLITHVLSWL
ncbi:MAG: cadmium resistance transporter [Lactobacillus sp.]|jgi:cadmium resistance protein CadD (predicted permease)|nr:cadmium resistance transporter [Lactobacillus sp.]MCI2033384.1 cadmium resistance transporter [Lactobacillus sp.]